MNSLSREPWFGKKDDNFGFRPISWKGWFTSTIFLFSIILINILALINYIDVLQIEIILLIIILGFILIVLLSYEKFEEFN